VRREDLAHILRAASRIAGDPNVVIIGSQAILGSYDADDLPPAAHASIEADVFFRDDPGHDKADTVDLAIGEDSRFHETFGYYAQGVGVETAVVAPGWEQRLVRYAPRDADGAVGWCLEPHDLVVAKLAAGREKDQEFADALLTAGLVDPTILLLRITQLPLAPSRQELLAAWVTSWLSRHP
jgi:hypothetical protein